MIYGRIFSYLNREDAKNLIGKEVAFCDRPSKFVKGFAPEYTGELLDVIDFDAPFRNKSKDCFMFIAEIKQESKQKS